MQALHELTHSDSAIGSAGGSGERRVALASLPTFDPAIMKEGYLQKKGQVLKGWKQRWFVCDGRTLCYYSHSRDARPTTIMELNCCTVEDGGRSETWNSTRIHLMDNATGTLYCLSSESKDVAMAWLVVLRNAIAMVTRERRQRLTGRSLSSVSTKESADTSRLSGPTSPPRRTNRLMSAPGSTPVSPVLQSQKPAEGSMQSTATATSGSVRKHGTRTATTVVLENSLTRDMELLKGLLSKHGSASVGSDSSSTVVFSALGMSNGVLTSLGTSLSSSSRWYARGTVVLPVPPTIAAYYVCDHRKRSEWDVQFAAASHVTTFDDSTELVYLTRGFNQFPVTRPYSTPHRVAIMGGMVGIVLAFPMGWYAMLSNVALFAIVAVMFNSMNFSSVCAPRDLLLLRRVMKRKLGNGLRGRSVTDEGYADDDDEAVLHHRNSVVTVLEKSVANERKPVVSGVVRAHQELGGWLLEPLDGGRTLVTFVTDIDAGGWLSSETKKEFLLRRVDCLAMLQGYLTQTEMSVIDDDAESADDSNDGSQIGDHSLDTHDGHDAVMENDGFHPSDYYKGMVRLPTGGVKLTDKEVAKKQAGVLKEVLKSASATLMEGKGMVSLSLPVRIFEPRTNLERIIDLFLYAPTFLNIAADQSDPVERFKYVMAYAVAGLHHGVGQMKPFNPILGETYQTELNDGTEVCCEHTSHHPPITNFELLGKKYSILGHVVWNPPTFSMKSSAFVQNNAGPIRVVFSEEESVSYHLPLMQSGGFLWGDRTVELLGTIHFEDTRNHLECDLKFHPDEKKGMGGMFSSSATPSDCVRGTIINSRNRSEVCSVSGSWLDGLQFDGKPYWTFGKERSGHIRAVGREVLLASDSRNRQDLRMLAAHDLDAAQEWKVKLEVLQRADRKLRNEGRRSNHWTLKDAKTSGH